MTMAPFVRTCLLVAGIILTGGGIAAAALLYVRSAPRVTCTRAMGRDSGA
jgi:hypothetical protein